MKYFKITYKYRWWDDGDCQNGGQQYRVSEASETLFSKTKKQAIDEVEGRLGLKLVDIVKVIEEDKLNNKVTKEQLKKQYDKFILERDTLEYLMKVENIRDIDDVEQLIGDIVRLDV